MKAVLMNNSINNNNNSGINLPIGNINFNKLGRNSHINYLQQLMNDEENSNINKFNESRVTNIPLSPSTTTDSDEIYDPSNRNEINAVVDKSIRLSRPSPSLKQHSPSIVPASPILKQITPNLKQFSPNMKQRNLNNVYPSPKLNSTGNVNIIKVISTSSSANPVLSHRPPTVTLRQNSEKYQQDNDSISSSPLAYYANNQSQTRKRNSVISNRLQSQPQSPLIQNIEIQNAGQYIRKHSITTKNNGTIDIDINNEQFIQQIENMNKSDNFMSKRNNETQQSLEYIEKVLKKVSTIRKEYENSSDVDGSDNAKERKIISSNKLLSSTGSPVSMNALQVVLPPPQPLPTHPPPPPPVEEDTLNNKEVVSPYMDKQSKQYTEERINESDSASITSKHKDSSKSMIIQSNSSSSSTDSPQLNSSNEKYKRNTTSASTNVSSSSAQIQALSQLSKQIKRASFQLIMESDGGKHVLKLYNDKGKKPEDNEENSTVSNKNLNRSRSLGSSFKRKYKTNIRPEGEIKGILRNSSKSNPDLTSSSEYYRSKRTEDRSKVTEEPSTESSTSKKSGIVGILKTTNNTIRHDSEVNRDANTSSSSKANDSVSEKSNKNMLISVLEKHHINNAANTNTVRFAIDDDTSSRGSLDEFDLKGMTADSMDQIANMLVNEEGEMKFDTKQQIAYHKKRLEECLDELSYRIGEDQVKDCIREDTIEINTYSWSDLSTKRTSIRILIDIIKHTFARSVILSDCRFSDLAAKCIAMAVKKNPHIKRLDITFCSKWARTQTDPISNILNYDSARYDSAWVLSKLVGPKAASAFANMLQVNTTLKVLQLRNASFGDTGVALIAKALQTNNVLECLEIDNCCTAEYGCHAIAESLKVNKSLQFLNLSQNPLSDRGGIAIVDALQENDTLKALVLHRCALSSSKFCDSFSKTLKTNQSLVEIDLGSNSFSKDGIKLLAEGLSHNSTLTLLKLEDCNLSKRCVNILSKALDSEENKTEIHLGSVLKFWDKKEDFNKRILFHKEQFA